METNRMETDSPAHLPGCGPSREVQKLRGLCAVLAAALMLVLLRPGGAPPLAIEGQVTAPEIPPAPPARGSSPSEVEPTRRPEPLQASAIPVAEAAPVEDETAAPALPTATPSPAGRTVVVHPSLPSESYPTASREERVRPVASRAEAEINKSRMEPPAPRRRSRDDSLPEGAPPPRFPGDRPPPPGQGQRAPDFPGSQGPGFPPPPPGGAFQPPPPGRPNGPGPNDQGPDCPPGE
jgi:hypothetical protein